MIKILTLYFTKDESTFNPQSLKSVMKQESVYQDVFVVSASPIPLGEYNFQVQNIVIPTRSSWPVPVKVAYSFNAALLITDIEVDDYDYIFKVDGDVILPQDYVKNLVSRKPLVAGMGPAMLISTSFFKKFLKKKYPINYCDDGYILAMAISKGIWPITYDGVGKINMPKILTLKDREFIYGIEYYKWGMPFFLLLILPITRIYLRLMKAMKPYQYKELKAFLFNVAGYLYALSHGLRKYEFNYDYGKMRLTHLYHSFKSILFSH
ncbi:MAG: hypothetical protein QXV51_03720 [Thermosphaera sp.]